MNDSILRENESKRMAFRLPLLICFAMFATWQMGVVYFSGNTLSLGGRTPLPMNIKDLTVLIAMGYISSIAVMVVLPRIIVWAARVSNGIALLSALMLFLPLPVQTLAAAYYVQGFCCLFMIGFEAAIIVNLFKEKTAIKHLLVAYPIANSLIALLHNDIVQVPFVVFRLYAMVAIALMLVFFFMVPANVWPRYVEKADRLVAPKTMFAGIQILAGLGCFVALFGSAVAESIPHGLSVFYLSSAGFGVIAFLLWKQFGVTPIHSGKVWLAFAALGFVAAIVAQYIPQMLLIACVFLGAGTICCWLNPFFAILIAKRYPSRFIVPFMIGIAFVTVLIHTALLGGLRDNLSALYAVYLLIAVALIIIYLLIEPYLLYSFRGSRAAALYEETAEAGGKRPVPSAASGLQRAKGLPVESLTDRERQIAQELMSGYSYSEIAKRLYISVHTVNTHRKSIYEKLGVHKVPELIAVMEKLAKTQVERDDQ